MRQFPVPLFLAGAAGIAWLILLASSQVAERRLGSLTAPAPSPRVWIPPEFNVPAGTVKIVQFYATPGEIGWGERSIVCYSVVNAQSVSLDPAVEELKPSLNRCFAVTPRKTTRYRLTAKASNGNSASAGFEIVVRPGALAAPRLVTTESGKP